MLNSKTRAWPFVHNQGSKHLKCVMQVCVGDIVVSPLSALLHREPYSMYEMNYIERVSGERERERD